jgi:hypothetical protein
MLSTSCQLARRDSDSCGGSLCLFFGLSRTGKPREYLLPPRLQITAMTPERRTSPGPAPKEPLGRGPPAPHPPEALPDVALGAITRQPIQAQGRRDRSDVLHPRSAVPGGLLHGEPDLRPGAGRRQAGASLARRDHGRWEPRLGAGAGRGCAGCGRLQPPRRPLSRHPLQRGTTRALLLGIPGPPPRGRYPCTPRGAGSVGTRGQRAAAWRHNPPWPSGAFCVPRSGLPGRPAAFPGCRAESGPAVDRVGEHGADSTPAWPAVGRRAPAPGTETSPTPQRSRAPARAHTRGGRLAPTLGWWAPTSRASDPGVAVPSGSGYPPHPVRHTA